MLFVSYESLQLVHLSEYKIFTRYLTSEFHVNTSTF